ncbi:MAG: hypothetical protein OXQ89_02285 [Rhodospirillaceae bacterium]|nr:hypothetical protein [Rhodospirillaceae bacterium]
MVDEIIRLLDYVKGSDDAKHTPYQRLFAGSWGSLVFHLALWTYTEAHPEINLTEAGGVVLRDTVLVFLPAYSVLFGAIVAFGLPKGSLVRHFVYGALLPAFAYGLAGTLLDAIGDVFGSVPEE